MLPELRIIGNILDETIRIRKTFKICSSKWKLLLKIIILGRTHFSFLSSEKVRKPNFKSSPILLVISWFWPKAALPISTVFKDHPGKDEYYCTGNNPLNVLKALKTITRGKKPVTVLNNSILISISPASQRWMLLKGQHVFDYGALVHLLTTQAQDFWILPLRTVDQEETIWFNLQS